MATTCPYCNMEVRESAIEAEDGCCPECGAVIGAASSFLDDPDDGDEYGDEYEVDDIFSDFDDEDDDNDFARADLEDDDIFLGDDLDGEFSDEEFDDEDDFDDEEDF